jgi:hypothetical protein
MRSLAVLLENAGSLTMAGCLPSLPGTRPSMGRARWPRRARTLAIGSAGALRASTVSISGTELRATGNET